MTVEQFKRMSNARPFAPFAIHMGDGRFLDVRHPEAAVLSPSGRTIQVLNRDRLTEIVDLLLDTSFRPLPKLRKLKAPR